MRDNKHIENFRKFNENLNISDVRSSKNHLSKDEILSTGDWYESKINRLEAIKEASVTDLVDGENLVWLMKKIILEQNERIEQLELKVAELRGEVEPD